MNDDQMIKWYAKRAAEKERLDALARAAYERDCKAAEYVCLQIENAALRDEAFDQQTELVHLRAAMRKQSQAIARKIDDFRVQIDILQAENAELREALEAFSEYVRNEQMSADERVIYSPGGIERLVQHARAVLAKHNQSKE